MKGSRFTEEQIIGVLREQGAGARTEEVCRRHGVSSATFLQVEIEVRRATHRMRKRRPSLGPHLSLGYLAPEEFAARNQGISAVARIAWPAQALAGAVQCAPTSDPKPDSFSAALKE